MDEENGPPGREESSKAPLPWAEYLTLAPNNIGLSKLMNMIIIFSLKYYWLLIYVSPKEIFPPKYSYDTVRKLKSIDKYGYWNPKPKSNYKLHNSRAKGFHQVQIIVDKEEKRIALFTKDSKEYSLPNASCVWNATPRSLSPLERNIGFWTQA